MLVKSECEHMKACQFKATEVRNSANFCDKRQNLYVDTMEIVKMLMKY